MWSVIQQLESSTLSASPLQRLSHPLRELPVHFKAEHFFYAVCQSTQGLSTSSTQSARSLYVNFQSITLRELSVHPMAQHCFYEVCQSTLHELPVHSMAQPFFYALCQSTIAFNTSSSSSSSSTCLEFSSILRVPLMSACCGRPQWGFCLVGQQCCWPVNMGGEFGQEPAQHVAGMHDE